MQVVSTTCSTFDDTRHCVYYISCMQDVSLDALHNQKRHRPDASCGFYQFDASLSSSCIKPVGFIKLHQACWLHQVVSSLLASSSCIKSVGFIKLHQARWLHQVASSLLASSSCIKSVGFIKLHQACWLHQVESSLLASSSCINSVKIRLMQLDICRIAAR